MRRAPLLAVVALLSPSGIAQSFRELECYRPFNQFDWPTSSYQISDNGQYATGYAGFGGVVRWDMEDVSLLWGVPESNRFGGMAGGISNDGQTVAGTYLEDTDNSGTYDTVEGRIWNGGSSSLVPALQSNAQVWVHDISGDGSRVVGFNTFQGQGFQTVSSVFRFDSATQQLDDLGPVPGLATGSQIRTDSSASVIVASGLMGGYWTQATGWAQLPGLLSEAHEVSDDGRYIVGKSKFNGGGYRGMVYDLHLGVARDVGALYDSASLYSIVLNGQYGVGLSGGPMGSRAVRWRDGIGFTDLNVEFADIIPTGWVLWEATDVTPDGRYILGTARNALGTTQSYVIDTVPEPATIAAMGVCLLGLARRSRRRVSK